MTTKTRRGRSKSSTENGSAAPEGAPTPLQRSVALALEDYFEALDGEQPEGLYELLMREVEQPLLEIVMARADRNQSRAATLLGLNRGTLRKKLALHGLLNA